MLKTLIIAVMPLLAAQVASADTTLASSQTTAPTPAQLMSICEGPGALSRGQEPCTSYWAQVQVDMTQCMEGVSNSRPAWHAQYLTCSKLIRANYQSGG